MIERTRASRPDGLTITLSSTPTDARQHGAGDGGAEARQREAAVDGEAEQPGLGARRHACGGGIEMRSQLGEALAGHGRHRNDGCTLQAGAGQNGLDARGRGGALGLVRQIALVERHHPMPQPQQVHDGQMLARLRHDAVVGGNHQDHEVDAGGAGQHVVHQALVARHIDEADGLAVGPRPVGEAQIDGDAARLLLLEPVGVDPGEPAHQRRLAVIDMAGGTDDHGPASSSSRGCTARRSASPISAAVQLSRTPE